MNITSQELISIIIDRIKQDYDNPLDFIIIYVIDHKRCVKALKDYIECDDSYLEQILIGILFVYQPTSKQIEDYLIDLSKRILKIYEK